VKESFDCLFSSAVVTVLGENESFARTVNFLRRGDSFGVSKSDWESRLYAKFHSILLPWIPRKWNSFEFVECFIYYIQQRNRNLWKYVFAYTRCPGLPYVMQRLFRRCVTGRGLGSTRCFQTVCPGQHSYKFKISLFLWSLCWFSHYRYKITALCRYASCVNQD